jgi:hypothetical protein
LLNKGLNELRGSQSACMPASGKFAMILESPMRERVSGSIQEPVQVNHSELLASPRPRANSMNTVMWELEKGVAGGRKKDPQIWLMVR